METPKVSKAQVAIVMTIVTTVASGVWIARSRIHEDDRAAWEAQEERLIQERDKCQCQLIRLLVPLEYIVDAVTLDDKEEDRVGSDDPWDRVQEALLPIIPTFGLDDTDEEPFLEEGTGESPQ